MKLLVIFCYNEAYTPLIATTSQWELQWLRCCLSVPSPSCIRISLFAEGVICHVRKTDNDQSEMLRRPSAGRPFLQFGKFYNLLKNSCHAKQCRNSHEISSNALIIIFNMQDIDAVDRASSIGR